MQKGRSKRKKKTLKSKKHSSTTKKHQKVSRETFYQVQIFKQTPISESLYPQKSKLLTIRSCKATKSNQKRE